MKKEMIRYPRVLLLSLFVASWVAVAALAWACTPQQQLSLLPRSGPPGSTITVNGLGFGSPGASGSQVEIRWNKSDGPLLGAVEASNFAQTVSIPPGAAPGVYYVLVLQRSDDGLHGKVSETFEVTSSRYGGQGTPGGVLPKPSSEKALDDLWSGFSAESGVEVSGPQSSFPHMPEIASGPMQATVATGLLAFFGGMSALAIRRSIRAERKKRP